MSKKDFTHLHVHTEYSTLDGINKVDKLCDYVKECGMSACAITDHGSMGGVIEFYKAAKKAEIKPIIGIEAYLTWDRDGLENKDKVKDNYHCVMLAQNETGLSNLLYLTNSGYLNNFYYKPRVSIENMRGSVDGIIATSACLGGMVSKVGVFNEEEKTFTDPENNAEWRLELFSELFEGRFYAEIQDLPKSWEQVAYNTWLVEKAREMDIPLIITSDAHFLTEDDYETHRLVMAKNMGKVLKEFRDDDDGLFYYREHCIRTPEKMYESACKYGAEEAFYNTMEVAEQCNLEITLGEYKYPEFDIEADSDYEEFLLWRKENGST